MSEKYVIVKEGETVNCKGCRYWTSPLTSAPCKLCAGARLDSERDYHTGRVKA